MAGYLFNLDSLDSLELYTRNGVYATKLPSPSGYWRVSQEGTFADYATMKKGDNVYFFIKRKIYGIGELVNIQNDCKFSNFPDASNPMSVDYSQVKDQLLWDEGDWASWTKKNKNYEQRWICVFKPAPHFFCNGVDMDDVLSSNPTAFKMLRAFWILSFIKFDEEENQAFRDVILKFNQEPLRKQVEGENIFAINYAQRHAAISKKLSADNYTLDVTPILSSCAEDDRLRREMAIEAGLLTQLSQNDRSTETIFGNWDYLSHQVIASPFKPIDYMDKMDIFGYSYVIGFSPTKSKFLVIEIKKDAGSEDDIEQLLKYVDWVKDEYCFGDYSMINAFLVAYAFDQSVIDHNKSVSLRKYTIGRRPAKSLEWSNLKLVRYRFNPQQQKLIFDTIV